MAGPNKLFHQKFEALAVIGLMATVPMIIILQGSIALVRTCSHRWGSFEVEEVPDDGQEPVIGDVESSELGGIFPLLGLPVEELLDFALAAFLFGQALSSRLVALGGYHDGLRGGPNVIFQCREFIHPSVQFLHSCRQVQG